MNYEVEQVLKTLLVLVLGWATGMILMLAISGCGTTELLPTHISTCTVKQVSDGAEITCPDGTDSFVSNGAIGEAGAQGAQGEEGQEGAQGNQGEMGQVGAPGLAGQDGQAGADGHDGATGATGPSGQDGSTGAVGPAGPAGLPGTQITAVQFCPAATPSYPSTFPEIGLCIAGNLYAVYNGGYNVLAYLPPGTYTSSALGSSCSFTILSGCVLQ